MRLLLIDDDPEIRHLARVALEKIGGHEVECATTGAQALERVSEAAPDAVLLDVMLPDADGVELLERLRRVKGMADVPVAFLTARSGTDEAARLDRAGARGTIRKPFDPLALSGEVDRLLGAANSTVD